MSEPLELPVYDAKVVTVLDLLFNSIFCFWKKPIIEMGYFKEEGWFIARVSYQNIFLENSKPVYAGMLHKHNKSTSKPVVHANNYEDLKKQVNKYIMFDRVTFKILANETLNSFGKVSGTIRLHAQ